MNYADELAIIDRFKENRAFDNNGSEGRFDLAQKNLEGIVNHPFGGLKKGRYAHNLWLDAARVSGWIPATLLIIIAWRCGITTLRIFRNNAMSEYFRIFCVIVTSCLLLYFNTEPILEGAPMLFTYFCLYFGIIVNSYNKKGTYEYIVYR